MKQPFIAAALVLTALTVAGCASKTSLSYDRNIELSSEEAKTILRQVFEEQPASVRPTSVEVDDDALRLGSSIAQKSFATGGVTTLERKETYYFSNLAELDLINSRGRVLLRLSNQERSVQRWVYLYDAKKGGNFIAALRRLQKKD